jgi:hypothetical protein
MNVFKQTGTKPLSPFGTLHNFCSKIAEKSQRRYTSLRTDIKNIDDEPGVMKYLLDVLIDLSLITKEESTSSIGGVAGSVNEGESDNEVEDGVLVSPASQPLMNESRRPSS